MAVACARGFRMYVKHKLGAFFDGAEGLPKARQQTRVIWARVPFKTSAGRLVGVRLTESGALEVAVAASPSPRWVPASRVLSEQQAQRWARCGF